MQYDISTLKQLDSVASSLASMISGAKKITLLLYGDLGTGKTTLTQYLAKHLGVTEYMQSPTYTLLREYRVPHDNKRFYHMDFYRIKDQGEVEAMGIWDILHMSQGIFCIEWPELIEESLSNDGLIYKVRFNLDNKSRTISIFQTS